jgi:hypothetical protein
MALSSPRIAALRQPTDVSAASNPLCRGLQRGDLVPATTSRAQGRESYHFVWPTRECGNDSAASFGEWLLGETAREA